MGPLGLVLYLRNIKMTSLFNKYGRYPREYNPKVHGPYHPGRSYGKPDIPLSEVKLGELMGWFMRRDKGITASWQLVHRGYWNWVRKFWQVKNPTFAGVSHIIMAFSTVFFFNLYESRSYHRHCKYH